MISYRNEQCNIVEPAAESEEPVLSEKPLIAITQGDPCGIGPEVVARALRDRRPYAMARPVVIGCRESLEDGVAVAGVDLKVRRLSSLEVAGRDPDYIDVLDEGRLDPRLIAPGRVVAECGRANGEWLETAAALCAEGRAAGTVMAPVNGEALVLGGALGGLVGTDEAARYLTLLSGPLRVVHLFDHVPLEDVCRRVSPELVHRAIAKTQESLVTWGVDTPRIGVAGLNPHAKGSQEERAIAPGVERARAEGIDATGPISPDTVFRHCIEGRYDVVVAMCHDQGHIAVKTWGFAGNCALFLGAPYLFLSVGHGTAFDIVRRGVADASMILAAILQAASLASGRGFLSGTGGIRAFPIRNGLS